MAEPLVKKNRIRAGHKGVVTKRIKEVDDLIAAATPEEPVELAKLTRLKLSLQEKLDTISKLDDEIFELIENEGELVGEIDGADAFKQTIYATVLKIDEQISLNTDASSAASRARVEPPPALATASSHAVRLPKLQLQSFDGDLTKWTTFWDAYESAIHSNVTLSDIDKFTYLRSLVNRSARDAIAGLTLSSANYHEAVSVLVKRFGNKQKIIAKHMDTLLNLEQVSSHNSIQALRHLYDQVESHVRSLKSLGVAADSYGNLLLPLLTKKLPAELRLVISRQVTEDDWSLDNVMTALENELKARERAAQSSRDRAHHSARESPTMATFVTGDSAGSLTCCFCRQNHQSHSCQTVTTPELRKQALRRSGRCFVCLKRGHLGRDCRSKLRCVACGGRHHLSICDRAVQHVPEGSVPAKSHQPPDKEQHRVTALAKGTLDPSAPPFANTNTTSPVLYIHTNKGVLLQTARAVVTNPHHPSRSLDVKVILDSGSQRSYITEHARKSLGLEARGRRTMSIMTFGSREKKPQECSVVKVTMQLKDKGERQLQMLSVPFICQPLFVPPVRFHPGEFAHLRQLELADTFGEEREFQPDILIGSDHYWDITTGETIRGNGGPVAMYTHLGWVLSGPIPVDASDACSTNLVTTHVLRVDAGSCDTGMDEQLKAFWELESLGVRENEDSVLDNFKESISFRDGRYQVSLPWKESHAPLADNYLHSLRRLRGLLQRLKQYPSILAEYDALIKDQLSRGVVEVVHETARPTNELYYMPHHAVTRQDKETTKLRIMYDASAKAEGHSLNDCLYAGPKYNQNILDIILRFRTYQTALVADIEKAFLQISVAAKDRDALRFLWIDDVNKLEPDIISLRFTRVPFGVTSSPFLLNATVQHHLTKYATVLPATVREMSRSMYVDDVAFGADSDDLAYELYVNSKTILKEGGFNLRKFLTNSTDLRRKIEEDEKLLHMNMKPDSEGDDSYAQHTLGLSQHLDPGETKVLGVKWEPVQDSLMLDFKDLAAEALNTEPTKRSVVRIASRLYDPIGLAAPVTIRLKILFQEMCQAKFDWDDPLPHHLRSKWQAQVASLQQASRINVPRYYFFSSPLPLSFSLQGFCDASKVAYAAVVYLLVDAARARYTRFVACKTRVAPVSGLTIPRLELLSALLLSKLMASVSQALTPRLSLEQPSYYMDSEVALFWIKGRKREWRPFVQNRVDQIRSMTSVDQWHHCPGTDNPADIPSRGADPRHLSNNNLWLHGPDWLLDGQTTTDVEDNELEMPESCKVEQRGSKKTHTLLLTTTPSDNVRIGDLMSCEVFSDSHKLLRVTAYVMRAAKLFKAKGSITDSAPTLSSQELAVAERHWISHAQDELVRQRNFECLRKQFGLFLDDKGLWRCGGRLQSVDVPYATKHPLLMPRRHAFTVLLVREAHVRVLHNGVKETLTELRSKFWVVKGRSLVKRVIHSCVICRRHEGRPYHTPLPPPLPSYRVEQSPPFSYTGVDFAGPLFVKTSDGSQKVWICLFTCCVMRAVHLEIVPDLTTPTFLRCLKRFAARRGLPRKIVSDNGKTFEAASKVIHAIFKHPEVRGYLSTLGVEWIFNLPRAPWWGGVFERMIRSTKRCLKKVIGKGRLSYDELLTALIEVEAVINSRPLSYLSSDDLEEPLTPSHLLSGRRLMNLPDHLCPEPEEFEADSSLLTRRHRYLNRILTRFWKRWRGEYLLELRDSHRYHHGSTRIDQLAVGNVVLIHDDTLPRGFWKVGVIEELLPGRDGLVRGATLRVVSKGRTSRMRRPLQRLYPLEVESSNSSKEQEAEPMDTLPSNGQNSMRDDGHSIANQEPRQRPVRRAAERANEMRKLWIQELQDEL